MNDIAVGFEFAVGKHGKGNASVGASDDFSFSFYRHVINSDIKKIVLFYYNTQENIFPLFFKLFLLPQGSESK